MKLNTSYFVFFIFSLNSCLWWSSECLFRFFIPLQIWNLMLAWQKGRTHSLFLWLLCAFQVFLVTLTNLQLRNCLTEIDSWGLFANLNELSLVRHHAIMLLDLCRNLRTTGAFILCIQIYIYKQSYDPAVTLDTVCFLLQVSFGFLNNLLRVIKDTLEISEGEGPTLLELLSKASVIQMQTHPLTHWHW